MWKKIISVVILTLMTSVTFSADNVLFKNGKSKYKIVISSEASVSENTAAKELQNILKEISGAELTITTDLECKGNKIFIGYNERVSEFIGKWEIADNDESFTYKTIGSDLFIYGGRQRGTMYGVFTFLEKELGCRWYTPDFSKIPKYTTWSFGELNHSESPAVTYRYSNYYGVENSPAWSAHNKENTKWIPSENEYGNLEAYWSAHTFGRFVPAAEFFESHPEYFALRNSKRDSHAQLCLSNPDVLKICTERLLKVMEDEPLYRIYSLSQNDNYGFCECESCKKIEQQYGSHSGLILWFVNQVADAVKKRFPDKYVGTFAYQYGRKPPVGIAPRDNVVVRLCDIECCFAHPLEAGCPQNHSFMEDLKGWKSIAPHIFIWDYIVNYAQYIAPFPNFSVLAPNIKTFRDNNAIGIFEEAQYQSGYSEFCELKTWVVTKLLWDPEQNTDDLVKEFINDYYGKSSSEIWEYYKLTQNLVKPDTHFGEAFGHDNPIYTDEFVTNAEGLVNKAMDLADNDQIRERVRKVRMQVLYLKIKRNVKQSIQDGTWDEFKKWVVTNKVRINEWQTTDKFIEDIEKSAQ